MSAPQIRVAVTIFATTETPSPSELAQLAERHGAEALLFPEHTHLPVGDVQAHPAGVTELPPEYARTFDPLIAATAAATASSRLRVGTAVCLVNQRDPIVTAKAIATIDQLSGGRFIFGVGAGWNAAEMTNHGVDPRRRHRMLRERIAAMTAIWTADESAYEGETVRFTALQSWPKPRSQPRPKILLGGTGPRAAERALAWADGWMPHTEVSGDERLLDRITDVRRRAPSSFSITLAMSPTRPERLQAYQRAGVDRFLFQLPSGSRDAVEERLDRVIAAAAHLD